MDKGVFNLEIQAPKPQDLGQVTFIFSACGLIEAFRYPVEGKTRILIACMCFAKLIECNSSAIYIQGMEQATIKDGVPSYTVQRWVLGYAKN